MKTSSNLKSKIWTPPRSILPPKPLAVDAHVGVAEDEAAVAEMAKIAQNVPTVVLLAAEEVAGVDDRKRDQGVQKVHEVQAATILLSWNDQTTNALLAAGEINVMIREVIPIPMTAS